MEELTFETFEVSKKENKYKAKKYLRDCWETNKFMAYVEKVKSGEENNKFIFATPRFLNGDYVYNPFTGNKLDKCYIYLNKVTCKEIEEKYILFNFDINVDEKFNKESLIRGIFSDVLTDYVSILNELNVNSQFCKNIDNKKNIPLEMYQFFKNLNEEFVSEIVLHKEELNKLHNIKENLNENIERQEKELRREKIEKIENEIKDNEQKLNDIKDIIYSYKRLGIFIENNIKDNEIQGRRDIIDSDSQIDYIHKYLQVKEGLEYKKDTIRRFYTALKTKQIIILSGLPGTGKTSLVNYFAEAIGAEAKIIPVQTNWSDNQDLLGFYNPVEKYYFSTPFLDALVEATENKDKLYFICLDEMNLARVEYYFSEFLSVLEKNKDSDKVLNLYSKFICKDLKEEVNKIKKGKDKASLNDEEKKLVNQFNTLINTSKRYPSEFTIPKNVRFIGTINADETTKEFSPKVIDRSLIIELLDENEEIVYSNEHIKDNLYIKPEEVEIAQVQDIDKNNFKDIYEIKDELTKLNVRLTRRFDRQLRELFSTYDWQNDGKFSDYIISSKILPKISVSYEDKTDENYNVLMKIKEKVKGYPISSKKLNQMLDRAEECKIVTYWI